MEILRKLLKQYTDNENQAEYKKQLVECLYNNTRFDFCIEWATGLIDNGFFEDMELSPNEQYTKLINGLEALYKVFTPKIMELMEKQKKFEVRR